MMSSISGTSSAATAPGAEVSRVARRPAADSFSARMAGVVIRTSPSVSSRTQSTLTARFHSSAIRLTSPANSAATDMVSLDALDDAGGRAFFQIRKNLHDSPQFLHQRRLGQPLARVIAALDEHVRPDHPDQLTRGV